MEHDLFYNNVPAAAFLGGRQVVEVGRQVEIDRGRAVAVGWSI